MKVVKEGIPGEPVRKANRTEEEEFEPSEPSDTKYVGRKDGRQESEEQTNELTIH